MQKKKENYITCLKVLACLLITNSHCREIYPYFFLAIGGSFGNAIFFIISGFCLSNIRLSFGQWYFKRAKRILFPLLLISGFNFWFITDRFTRPFSVGILIDFINSYWFVFAILIYYIIFYFIFSSHQIKWQGYSLIIYCIGYLMFYLLNFQSNTFWVEPEGFHFFKVYFYFGIFLLGGIISQNLNLIEGKINKKRKKTLYMLLLIMSVACGSWGLLYAILLLAHRLYSVQFLIQFFVCLFTVAIFLICNTLKKSFTLSSPLLNPLINGIGDSTLEIYLVQVTFIKCALDFPFPINWSIFWGIALMGGTLLHQLVIFIRSKFIVEK